EAKAQRDLLETYLLKYSDAVSRTDVSSALPDVRVVTLAAPAVQPASPRTGLILGAVAFLAVALQAGGVLFGELMSGRALTSRRQFDQVTVVPVADASEPELDLQPPPALEPDTVAAAGYPEEPVADEPAFPEPVPEPDVDDTAAPPDAAPADPDRFGMAPFIAAAAARQQAAEATAETTTETTAEAPAAAAVAGVVEEPAAPEAEDLPLTPDPADGARELANLSADIAIGRVRVVLLAALEDHADCVTVSDRLVADALRRGLSVACVDAGSGRPSSEPGLSDLSADLASFGDVVHKV